MERSELRRMLDEALTADSLRVLCHRLGVDHDNLEANNKVGRIRELIGYLERQGRIAELHTLIERNQLPDRNAKLHLTRQERLRQRALFNVRSTWIEGVLDHLVSDELYLTLGLEYKPTAVAKRTLRTASQADTPIPEGKPIREIFVENGRSLLILGAPGSGKTITLLQLGRDLINEALQNPKAPLPFVVNLSSWAAKQGPLAEWLVEELFLQYQFSRKLARSWLAKEQLTLLLDGLDEVAEAQRETCVEAINAFKAESDVELVVCSRLADYERLEERLNVGTAVVIQPLTDEQVDEFLQSEGLKFQAVRDLLENDDSLKDLAKIPLMLNIISVAYAKPMPEEIDWFKIKKSPQQRVFGSYIERVFNHRPLNPQSSSYSELQALTWLASLGGNLHQHSQSVFYIEQLQPSWFPVSSSKWNWLLGSLYGGVFCGVLVGLIIGITFGLYIDFASGLFVGLSSGVITLISIGLIVAIQTEIKLVEKIVPLKLGNFLWFSYWKDDWVAFMFFWVVVIALLAWVDVQVLGSLLLIAIVILGFRGVISLSGLVFSGGLSDFITTNENHARILPNQGISHSLKNSIRVVLLSILITLAIPILIRFLALFTSQFTGEINEVLGVLYEGLAVAFVIGLSIGLFIGLFQFGGTAVIQHYTLRYFLSRENILPYPFSDKKLVAFLDAMAERMILRRVGGGWIFIHRTLLEYFAALTPEEIEQLAADSE
ncbi:MAG: NACHT domain-containing protein [Chloroflexota bacterium]